MDTPASTAHFAGRVFPAAAVEMRQIRRWVRDAAQRCGLTGTAVDDLVLVASELVANAVEASRSGHRIAVELRVDDDDATTLVVENVGPAFARKRRSGLPDPSSERGRGLAIVELLGHVVRSEHRDGHTRVVARRGPLPLG